MVVKKDGNGSPYLELSIGLPVKERLRVTLIEKSTRGTPSLRIQVKEANGHLRQGPEIPISSFLQVNQHLGELMEALIPVPEDE